MSQLLSKLRSLKSHLIALHKSTYSDIATRVKNAKADLLKCQLELQASPLHPTLLHQSKALLRSYIKLRKAELLTLNQRAKMHHLMLDDSNSKYFYARVTERKHRSSIGSIHDISGKLCTSFSEVAAAFISYYMNLLGSDSVVKPIPPTLFQSGLFSPNASPLLLAVVGDEEIRSALASIDNNSSPGIDGYNSGFFKDSWNVVGPDFCAAVRDFFQKGKMVKATNTKILANRLKCFMGDVMGDEQAAFVQGRDIFDNSFLAQELANKYSRSLITPRCIVKVDIKKAFDSVNWAFLHTCLIHYGLPPQFVK
ncbi:uncharacterized protein LOC141620252 [Silene latifolia]|uniref:uncharacterized protein LOC141620252 n=1 Tax=Silene latifolia TaxID=37657 RepID=UPI003D77DCDC